MHAGHGDPAGRCTQEVLPELENFASLPPAPCPCSYINEYPTGRLLRDAKLYEIGAGTSGEAASNGCPARWALQWEGDLSGCSPSPWVHLLSPAPKCSPLCLLPAHAEIRRMLIGRELFKESAP